MTLTEPRRYEDRPSDKHITRGSSTRVWPKAHSIPANHPDRVALKVEARNNGPGVRAPEELAITTVSKKSGVNKPN